jgi:drug/metabolite transporter (DMT)-like permease
MAAFVFAAVLLAAAFHAGWNAAIKYRLDPLVATVPISLGATAIAVVLVPLTGFPALPSWPFVIASIIVHLGYFAFLIESYRAGDMSQVYPLARGAAPLITASLSPLIVGEAVADLALIGIAILAAGVTLLSLRGGRKVTRINVRAIGFALLTALMICTYSLVDGMGARLAGTPHAYSVALFAGIGPVMLIYAGLRGGRDVISMMRPHVALGLAGGLLQFASYGIAIWAMTLAPIAVVAALRETSVLFGAVIAVMVLKEPLGLARIFAVLMIISGLALIRLS